MVMILFYTGQIALFSIYFISLIIHEIGHLLFARWVNVQLESCVIYPFGGQIRLKNEWMYPTYKKIIIAIGGPIATLGCILVANLLPDLIAIPFYKVNLFLLCINLLPIYPLDGGRVILNLILYEVDDYRFFSSYLAFSIFLLISILIFSVFSLPNSLPLIVISIFLLFANLSEWKTRKYRVIFEKTLSSS